MYQSISQSDFTTAFHRMDRGEQFSYGALVMLFDYLEQYEDDTGEQIELDVIALCCDYTEASYADIIGDYDTEIGEALGDAGIELGKAVEDAIAQPTQHPALDDADAGFDLGLVARLVGARGNYTHTVVHGHLLVRRVQVGIVAAGFRDSGLGVVGQRLLSRKRC